MIFMQKYLVNFQIFYLFYLTLFSYAVIIPSCGDFYIDLVVYFWTAMIWVEIIRKTIIKRKVDLPVTLIFFFNAIYIYLN